MGGSHHITTSVILGEGQRRGKLSKGRVFTMEACCYENIAAMHHGLYHEEQLLFSEFPTLPPSQIRRRMNQMVGEDCQGF